MQGQEPIRARLGATASACEMKIAENVSLDRFTTYRIGGPARWYSEAASVDALRECLRWAGGRGAPVFALGGGSNVVIDDAGFPGLVVRLVGELAGISFDEGERLVVCGAGARLKKLGREATSRGLADFLFMTGIPGTVGGAVVVNAGTREGEVSRVCEWVEAVDNGGALHRFSPAEMAFGYRCSALQGRRGLVVTRAAFRFGEAGEPATLKICVRDHLLDRKAREPKIRSNCGSVFKAAPDGTPAGLLIDRAGLKGARVGGAMIANEHANWIVNTGGATAADVRSLAELARVKVLEIFGVDLRREVVYVPQDLKPQGME